MKKSRAFTLVELLVVIGIIALLISVLLPALSAARRQAAAVKCAASLREIGNAYQMYSMDNKGYWPPAKLLAGSGGAPKYSVNGFDYDVANASSPYWSDFLAKYVTKTKVGYSAGASGSDASQAKEKSIFWACPAWDGYNAVNAKDVGGYAITQSGYGMNAFPDYTASYPIKGLELGESSGDPYDSLVDSPAYKGPGWSIFTLRWYKQKAWTRPSERALAGDALFWLIEARPPLNPPQMAGQYMLLNNQTWSGGGAGDGAHETTFDWYRHGKYPPKQSTGNGDTYDPHSGKVAFNVLFADGHVSTITDQATSYRIVRMKYPG